MKYYLALFTLLIVTFSACKKDPAVVTEPTHVPTIDSIPSNTDTTTYPKYFLVDCEYEADILDRSTFSRTISNRAEEDAPLTFYSKDSFYCHPAGISGTEIRGTFNSNNYYSNDIDIESCGYKYIKRDNDTIYFELVDCQNFSWYVKIKGKGIIQH